MKKKFVVLIAAVVVLAVVAYFALPALLMKWASDSERKAAGLEQKTAHVGDHEIVYIEGGQGEAILMVHGFAANKDNWTRFAKFISPVYHVVALYWAKSPSSSAPERPKNQIPVNGEQRQKAAERTGRSSCRPCLGGQDVSTDMEGDTPFQSGRLPEGAWAVLKSFNWRVVRLVT